MKKYKAAQNLMNKLKKYILYSINCGSEVLVALMFLMPRTGRSTVSTRASNPAASDRLIKFSVTALSLKMHNCIHFLTLGAEAATFSIEQELAMLRMKTVPFS